MGKYKIALESGATKILIPETSGTDNARTPAYKYDERTKTLHPKRIISIWLKFNPYLEPVTEQNKYRIFEINGTSIQEKI